MYYKSFHGKLASAQQGAVLVIGLIMLLLMTIVGISAIQGSGMQELMAGNMRDRQISFQSAESGLRVGEIAAGAAAHAPGTAEGVQNLMPLGGSADFWQSTYQWATGSNSKLTTLGLALASEESRYVIEPMNVALVLGGDGSAADTVGQQELPAPDIYRITSRGVGMSTDSITLLQSIFRRE